jgi:hypothetical protein
MKWMLRLRTSRKYDVKRIVQYAYYSGWRDRVMEEAGVTAEGERSWLDRYIAGTASLKPLLDAYTKSR